MKCNLHWGDGFAIVEPDFPDTLLKKLRYWKRDFEFDRATYTHVVTGHAEELYSVQHYIDDQQQPRKRLITMPGLLSRIINYLTEQGWEYEIRDERTPMPEPDVAKALSRLRAYQQEGAYTMIMSGGGIGCMPTGWG